MLRFRTVTRRSRFVYSPYTAIEMQGFAQVMADAIRARIQSGQTSTIGRPHRSSLECRAGAATPTTRRRAASSPSAIGRGAITPCGASRFCHPRTLSTFPAYIVNGRGNGPRRQPTRRRIDRQADIVVGGLQGDRSWMITIPVARKPSARSPPSSPPPTYGFAFPTRLLELTVPTRRVSHVTGG
jgi:hypothetical protein